MDESLDKIGKPSKEIEVRFDVRSIQLFSDGLYSSPHKAIEELVSNSYDAGANHVNVVLRDLGSRDGSIVVIDDGIGMNDETMAAHWLIGDSSKRDPDYVPPMGRAPIGKFGIGKLATYVLADKFHLVSKCAGKYWIATMDYDAMIPKASAKAHPTREERQYKFWVRTMTQLQAQRALLPYTTGDGAGYHAIKLFGAGAAKTWTVAILNDLRELSAALKIGVTRWVLSTALPLRSDFKIYLDGIEIESSKATAPLTATWQLGETFTPNIESVVSYVDPNRPKTEPSRVGIVHPALGRIYGSFDLYENIISEGKSDRFGRSHGFFVYVRGRLLNEEDPYFGIAENSLRHGTFSRFRMDVHIDALDEELRSSRETYLETSRVDAARDILRACFAHARARQHAEDVAADPSKRLVDRLQRSPRSLTTTPMLSLIERAAAGRIHPRLTRVDLSASGTINVSEIKTRENLFQGVDLVTTLGPDDGICVFDPVTGKLEINLFHPFVAHFADEFDNKRARVVLELLATSEVLLEASFYETIADESIIQDLLEQRDSLLRALALSTENRSPSAVAMRLLDASSGWAQFEVALVDSFGVMGFEAVHLGGAKKPDGIAEAHLSATKDGERRAYSVSLEAKKHKGPISKDEAKLGTVAIHRDKFNCDHAIIVARQFTEGEEATLIQEIKRANEADVLRYKGLTPEEKRQRAGPRTLTLAKVDDIAALVRLFAYKRIRLDSLRDIFACESPAEVSAFVANQKQSAPNRKYFPEILAAIAALQQSKATMLIEYGMIEYYLLNTFSINMDRDEIKEACHAMQLLSNDLIFSRPQFVELNQDPALIRDAIMKSIDELPENERHVVRETYMGAPIAKTQSKNSRGKKGKAAIARKRRAKGNRRK